MSKEEWVEIPLGNKLENIIKKLVKISDKVEVYAELDKYKCKSLKIYFK